MSLKLYTNKYIYIYNYQYNSDSINLMIKIYDVIFGCF